MYAYTICQTDRYIQIRHASCLSQVLRPNSLFTNLVIDYEISGAGRGDGSYYGFQHQTQQTCDDAFLYISDTASAAIVVYDLRRDAAWRIFHPTMLPHPDHSTYYVSLNTASNTALKLRGVSPRGAPLVLWEGER